MKTREFSTERSKPDFWQGLPGSATTQKGLAQSPEGYRRMDLGLNNKVAIVAGASRGLGAATAREFARGFAINHSINHLPPQPPTQPPDLGLPEMK